MANENLESGQAEGSEGTTNSDASQGSGDKQASTFSAEQVLEQLRETIKEEVGKATQSTKDKRFSEIEKKLGDFQPVLERFKDLVTPEQLKQIQKDLEFEDLKQRVYGEKQTSEPVSAGNTQAPAVDAAKLFDEMGLDRKDPLVNTVLAGLQGKDKDAVELAGYRLANKIQSSPAPTPAQGASLQGKPPVSQDVEARTTQYKTDMLAARGNESQLTRIREQAIKDGVPVWTIDFS